MTIAKINFVTYWNVNAPHVLLQAFKYSAVTIIEKTMFLIKFEWNLIRQIDVTSQWKKCFPTSHYQNVQNSVNALRTCNPHWRKNAKRGLAFEAMKNSYRVLKAKFWRKYMDWYTIMTLKVPKEEWKPAVTA